MPISVQCLRSRAFPIALLSFFALHCGTTPGPDGDTDSETGGASPGTGGENLGGSSGSGGTESGGTTSEGTGGGMGGEATGGSGSAPIELTVSTIDSVDVLFVVDNSISMADKQALFVRAVPKLIERLVAPDCIDLNDGDRTPSDNLTCPAGAVLEIAPIDDLHLGVISSSIGGFGAGSICAADDDADKSLLIPKVRLGAPDPSGLGFLEWSGGAADEVAELNADFAAQIDAVGETGCGFEAPLEAWYRFLVDPSPPLDVVKDSNNRSVSTGIDAAILEQRSEFLRPDSLVAIVMLTDEDDCSAMEGGGYYPYAGFGWLVPDITRLRETASEECATNPNDACCYSCLQTTAPDGCDDSCERNEEGQGAKLADEDDRANVRCHQNQRRFGVDVLYPISRYVDGLSKKSIVDTQLTTDPDDPILVPNPLLLGASLVEAERLARPPNQVFLTGIVGVPWQDIATAATRDDPDALEYITAKGLSEPDDALGGQDRWTLILGQPHLAASSMECEGSSAPAECGQAPVPPLDPFMIDSIQPRSGTNPITGDSIVGTTAAGWSPINGSEYDNSVPGVDGQPANDDLQYACIFPLAEEAVKEDCTPGDSACDCGEESQVPKGRPLCKPVGSLASTPATSTQYWGKAYPAKRILQVLKGFGENSIVASICPKILDEPESPYFGYGPALDAVVERLAGTRGGVCLTPKLAWDEADDEGTCAIVEATTTELDCSRAGRTELPEEILPTALEFLETEGFCGDDSTPCEDVGVCALAPVDDVAPCFGPVAADSQPAGYCLIDPALGPAGGGEGEDCTLDPSTWEDCDNGHGTLCPGSDGRMVRFVGESTPEKGAVVFRACAPE